MGQNGAKPLVQMLGKIQECCHGRRGHTERHPYITTHCSRAGQCPAKLQYLKWHAVEIQKVNKRHHRASVALQHWVLSAADNLFSTCPSLCPGTDLTSSFDMGNIFIPYVAAATALRDLLKDPDWPFSIYTGLKISGSRVGSHQPTSFCLCCVSSLIIV